MTVATCVEVPNMDSGREATDPTSVEVPNMD